MCVCVLLNVRKPADGIADWMSSYRQKLIEGVDNKIPTNARTQTRRPDDSRTTRVEVETLSPCVPRRP